MTMIQSALEYARGWADPSLHAIIDKLIKSPKITAKIDYAEVGGPRHTTLLLAAQKSEFRVWLEGGVIFRYERESLRARVKHQYGDSIESVLKNIDEWADHSRR